MISHDLNSKTWYRLIKVLSTGVVVLSFFAPLFLIEKRYYSNEWWVLDGLTNVVAWVVIFLILKWILVYVLYGQQKPLIDRSKGIEESWTLSLLFIGVFGVVGLVIGWGFIGFGLGLGALIFLYIIRDIVKK